MTFVKGQKFTEEHRERLRAAKLGTKQSEETRQKRATSLRMAKAPMAKGFYLSSNGYRMLTTQHDHPLRNSSGDLAEHRKVLYDEIGPGPHPCHWGCGKMLDWDRLQPDHVDGDKLNNDPENLVPSCSPCNVSRASCGNPSDWSASQMKGHQR